MITEVKFDQPYEIGHRATEGHFTGHPIIPGVVILADVMCAFRKQNANQNMLAPGFAWANNDHCAQNCRMEYC
jgi:3-hydroxymyristoyl/3-hydroxydecanoyl-(acyl carrier protein) dehydratase